MSKIDYTLLLFVAVLLFSVFCVWFNIKITNSDVGKRVTWYLMWTNLGVMIWLLVLIFVKIGQLKGD